MASINEENPSPAESKPENEELPEPQVENEVCNPVDVMDEEEEEDDVMTSLASFASDILNSIGSSVEPLDYEEKQPRPLSPQGHDLAYSVRLLQVN